MIKLLKTINTGVARGIRGLKKRITDLPEYKQYQKSRLGKYFYHKSRALKWAQYRITCFALNTSGVAVRYEYKMFKRVWMISKFILILYSHHIFSMLIKWFC